MSAQEHQAQASNIVARFAVLTLSDTRTLDTDTSGAAIVKAIQSAGHVVADRTLIPDEATRLAAYLSGQSDVDAIITTGGTGVSKRDITLSVVVPKLDRELRGFGELFRALSYEQIGVAAMMSNATAGFLGDKLIFCLPGSTPACELAMSELILPQIKHLLSQARK